MLDLERAFYATHLPEWVLQHHGKFVLVKDQRLVGVYDTFEMALAESMRQFGLSPALVRRVDPQPIAPVSVPALTLGLLHAHPAPAV